MTNDPVILLSYPRSGNTWVRYFIEFVTKKPTWGCRDNLLNDLPLCYYDDNSDIDYESVPAAIKEHFVKNLWPGDIELPLMVVTRNYKEAIIRHNLGAENHDIMPDIINYLNVINVFDKWPNTKIIVYYEELINKNPNTYYRICDFVQGDQQLTQELLDNYDYHAEKCIALYTKDHISHTRGKLSKYHTNSISIDQLNEFDSVVKNVNEKLYDLYLAHYGETT